MTMSVIKYNKLVRDRIPEIIEASGKTCKTVSLNDVEYLHILDAKLSKNIFSLVFIRFLSLLVLFKSLRTDCFRMFRNSLWSST